jgi:glycosyltransferase involved in cell wall biosynthesis
MRRLTRGRVRTLTARGDLAVAGVRSAEHGFELDDVTPAGAEGLRQTSEVRPGPRVSVVVPTLNEAQNLPHVLPKLSASYEVVIVDGGSTDGTVAVALELLPDAVVVGQTRRGKGNALACGFAAASGDIIVMLDADGSARADEIPLFVEVLERGADFAKGSRYLEGGGSADITWLRTTGNRLFSLLVNVLFRTRYTDLCYGYNAFWSRCLPCLSVDCDGFEVETLINIRACKAGLLIVEVPSYEERRIHGTSNLRTFRDGFRVLRTIFRERFRGQHVELPSAIATAPASAR